MNGWKRAKADFLNYQKDETKRLEEFTKFANESLILELISLADEADIALKHMPKEIKENHYDWVSGAIEIRKKFDEFLEKNGISKIKTIGEIFNPALHEAVAVSSDLSPEVLTKEEASREEREIIAVEKEADRVIEEVSAGYIMHGKVIRPARVKINK